jgi:hypothetical protein
MVGIGGVQRAMGRLVEKRGNYLEQTCTCGASAQECPFWGEVVKELEGRTSPDTLLERYELALKVFGRVFGEEVWAVDSTKRGATVGELARMEGLDLRVIHLAKDYRAAMVSLMEKAKRRGPNKPRMRPQALLALEAIRRWVRGNQELSKAIEKAGVKCLNLGYEELCLEFDGAVQAICEFTSLPVMEMKPAVTRSRSHLLSGNRMRKQEEKAVLKYDYRWLTRKEWMWIPIFVPSAAAHNREWVFSNGLMERFSS